MSGSISLGMRPVGRHAGDQDHQQRDHDGAAALHAHVDQCVHFSGPLRSCLGGQRGVLLGEHGLHDLRRPRRSPGRR